MESSLVCLKLLLLLLIISSSTTEDNLHRVRRWFHRTTDSVPSAANWEVTSSRPAVNFSVKAFPSINYKRNFNIDIGKASSNVGRASKAVLKAPFYALSAIKNSATHGFLNIANSIPIINQFGPKIKELSQQIQIIKPGTKWCGSGNTAKDINDIGYFQSTDSCCRGHDMCPEYILAKSAKYYLINDGSFTRSSCNCDSKFYKCLKEAGNPVSFEVGLAYFDILKPLCFRFDFPRIECKKYFGNQKECRESELDFTKAKTWQWFPSPSFVF